MKNKHWTVLGLSLFVLFYIAWAVKFETMDFNLWKINREWIGFHLMMVIGYGGCIVVVKMVEEGFK